MFNQQPEIHSASVPLFSIEYNSKIIFTADEFNHLNKIQFPTLNISVIDAKVDGRIDINKTHKELSGIKKNLNNKRFIVIKIPSPFGTKDESGKRLIEHVITVSVDANNKYLLANDPMVGLENSITGNIHSFSPEIKNALLDIFPSDEGWTVDEDKTNLEQVGELTCYYLAAKKAQAFSNGSSITSADHALKDWRADMTELNNYYEHMIDSSLDSQSSGITGRLNAFLSTFAKLAVANVFKQVTTGERTLLTRSISNILKQTFTEHHYKDFHSYFISYTYMHQELSQQGKQFVDLIAKILESAKSQICIKDKDATKVDCAKLDATMFENSLREWIKTKHVAGQSVKQ